jgi:hypothetical protein
MPGRTRSLEPRSPSLRVARRGFQVRLERGRGEQPRRLDAATSRMPGGTATEAQYRSPTLAGGGCRAHVGGRRGRLTCENPCVDWFSLLWEASGFLVGPAVFKTDEASTAGLAGSIPVRLRSGCAAATAPVTVGDRAAGAVEQRGTRRGGRHAWCPHLAPSGSAGCPAPAGGVRAASRGRSSRPPTVRLVRRQGRVSAAGR